MKRIPGIEPSFTRCRIVRPDGSVLPAWEMFVGERSYGRSDSKAALLRAWEARLEEAENSRPFVFRPQSRFQRRDGAKPVGTEPARDASSARGQAPALELVAPERDRSREQGHKERRRVPALELVVSRERARVAS